VLRITALALEVRNPLQCIQELMTVVEVEEPNGKVSTMGRVICQWI
jgi:hypothetical protein